MKNPTSSFYETDRVFQELFERQAAERSNHTALIHRGQSMTYEELNQKANQLAGKLRSSGVTPDTLIALMVRRSMDMIVGILAILKAGGCYLPIDPDFPANRVAYMLQDSQAPILLTHSELIGSIDFAGTVYALDNEELYEGVGMNLPLVNRSEDLIYVIYTSGSTGNPKGVSIKHQSVHNFIHGVSSLIDFSPGKTIACMTTISFDIFVLEALLPLARGMTVHIADPRQLFRDLQTGAVDMLQTTPSTMRLILNEPRNIPYLTKTTEIMLGGEPLPPDIAEGLQQYSTARLYNMYGPTETTIWSAIKEVTTASDITIGKPIANTQVYIVDEQNQPLPAGAVGELCISGDGVARGYYNKAALTSERFVSADFLASGVMYKTGDLARWLENGELEFKGRKDNQAKIRGYRIELDEIERELLRFSPIKECVAAVKETESSEQYLAAYYIAEMELSPSDLIRHLAQFLPEYMIPNHYMHVQHFPLTPNGKLDRKALPEPDRKRPKLTGQFALPESELERQISRVWEKVLNYAAVGIHDNFFELGGTSSLLAQVYMKLDELFPGKLDITDIFAYPSISRLAAFLSDRSPHEDSSYPSGGIRMLFFAREDYAALHLAGELRQMESWMDAPALHALNRLKHRDFSAFSLFISVSAFLISQMTGQEQVRISALPDEAGQAASTIDIDFNRISEFEELYGRVQSHEAMGHKRQPEFSFSTDDHSGSGFRLALSVNELDSGYLFRLSYPREQSEREAEDFMKGYFYLLNEIISGLGEASYA